MLNSAARLLKNPRIWQAALACYWLAILLATHLPSNVPFLPPDRIDKLVHFTTFAILAGLLATTWQLSAGHLTLRHLVIAWIVVVVYGALDELTQIPVGRQCSAWDWLADAIGAAVGLVVFVWLRNVVQRRMAPAAAPEQSP